jgi:hypothetical protein
MIEHNSYIQWFKLMAKLNDLNYWLNLVIKLIDLN